MTAQRSMAGGIAVACALAVNHDARGRVLGGREPQLPFIPNAVQGHPLEALVVTVRSATVIS